MKSIRNAAPTVALVLLLAVFATAFAVAFLAAPAADAEPYPGTHVNYYSDAQLTNRVGYRYYLCNGQLWSGWGSVTPYSTSATYGCGGGDPF